MAGVLGLQTRPVITGNTHGSRVRLARIWRAPISGERTLIHANASSPAGEWPGSDEGPNLT